MKIHATFIGINKHEDVRIPELTGAARDARALWSLFSDTIPDVDATLLVDQDATTAVIRHAITTSLGQANSDDIVIFSFSGHGTNDHHLVTFDTDYEALVHTTISMGELAEYFRTCKAQAIVCILDCCFSGAAPARVLEGSPISRDFKSLFSLFAGKGRILIAAAAENEPPWEQPGTGHGLLTKALIEVLSQGESHTVTLTSAIDEIAMRTRVEAARIGVKQNPVFLTILKGG